MAKTNFVMPGAMIERLLFSSGSKRFSESRWSDGASCRRRADLRRAEGRGRIVELCCAGRSCREIATALDAEGYRPPAGPSPGQRQPCETSPARDRRLVVPQDVDA